VPIEGGYSPLASFFSPHLIQRARYTRLLGITTVRVSFATNLTISKSSCLVQEGFQVFLFEFEDCSEMMSPKTFTIFCFDQGNKTMYADRNHTLSRVFAIASIHKLERLRIMPRKARHNYYCRCSTAHELLLLLLHPG